MTRYTIILTPLISYRVTAKSEEAAKRFVWKDIKNFNRYGYTSWPQFRSTVPVKVEQSQ